MNQFRYVAVGSSGERVSGEIAAKNEQAVESQLAAKSLFALRIEPVQLKAEPAAKPFAKKHKVKSTDVTELLRSIAVMLGAGVPMVEALTALAENASNPAVRDLVKQIRSDVLGGSSLTQAMKAHPKVFPDVISDMISVSDESGRLVDTLQSSVAYLEKTQSVKKNVIGALIYPSILIGASITAFFALVVLILPTFNEAFSSMGVKLPWFTVALIKLGEFIKANTVLCLSTVIGGFFGLKFALKQPKIKQQVQVFLTKIPVIGPILFSFSLNRSLRTLSSLLSTKVPIVDSLDYARRVSGHVYLDRAFEQVKNAVGNGSTLADSMTATALFPKMAVQMIAVGERSGRLAEMITTVVDHSESDVDRKIKSAVSILEPVVIIGMGLVVGLITVSILMPLFNINNNIK